MSKRDQYIEKFEAKLDEWNGRIDQLEAQAREARTEAKGDYEDQLKELRARRDEARARLAELRAASDSAWEDVKRGAEAAWQSLSDAVEDATKRFK